LSRATKKKTKPEESGSQPAKKRSKGERNDKAGRGGGGAGGEGTLGLPQGYLEKLRKNGPVESVTNREDYRYTLAEENPHISEAFRERYIEQGVFLSREDRSPFIFLGKDRLTAWTEKGFRLARASHCCHSGSWYYEVQVLEAKGANEQRPVDGPHVRVGWAQRFATIEAPVGFDEFGYSFRDKTGDKVHLSIPVKYGEPCTQGDVIGLLIELPGSRRLLDRKRGRTPIVVKGTLYFEEPVKKPEKLGRVPGSRLTFFKNGVSQGEAFTDLFEGDYYPAISLYRGGHVQVNFGPDFQFPPPPTTTTTSPIDGSTSTVKVLPFSDRFLEQAAEEAVLDIVEDMEIEEQQQQQQQ